MSDCYDRQKDGSFFIDTNFDSFQHILKFMRRTSKFSLIWTKEMGFDYALYNNLEPEAHYFLLNDLGGWIRQKRYLDAVHITFETKALSEFELYDRNSKRLHSDADVRNFFGSYSREKRYRCPLGTHSEDTRYCSDKCMDVTKAHGSHFHDPAKKLTVIIKTTRFIETICANDGSS